MKKIILLFALFYSSFCSMAQLHVTTGVSANQVVQTLVGHGITFSNATLHCPNGAFGIFGNGATTNLGLDSGIVLTTGTAGGVGSAASVFNDTQSGAPGDIDLNTYNVTVDITHDACSVEFDVVPICDTLRFKYVFGSEEYPEWVADNFADAFAFFISGPGLPAGYTNIALIPSTTTPINIHTVNEGDYDCPDPATPGACVNCAYYVPNCSGTSIVYDAFTTVLTAEQIVQSCQTYHVKLLIADGGDDAWDSGVFLKRGTLDCFGVSIGASNGASDGIDAVENCQNGQFQICLSNPQPAPFTFHFTVGGTATSGLDYTAFPDSVVFPPNQECVTIDVFPVNDGLPEGIESVKIYFQPSACAATDSVHINIYDTYFVDAGSDVIYCSGDSVRIGPLPVPGTTYAWSPSAGLSDSTVAQPWVHLTNFGATPQNYYYVLNASISSCSDVDSVMVTVNVLPGFPDAGLDSTFCIGTTVPLGAPAVAGITYLWIPGAGLSDSTIANPNATPTITTDYELIASNSCGSMDDFVFLVVNQLPVANAGTDVSMCTGGSAVLNGSGGTTYLWSPTTGISNSTIPNPTVAPPFISPSYILTATNNCGSDMDTVNVVIEFPIAIDAGQSVTVCKGTSTTLNAVSTAGNYHWSPATGLTSVTIQNPVATPLVTTPYSVSSTNSCGTVTDVITVNVLPLPVAFAGPDVVICAGDSADLLATGGINYSWNPTTGLSNSLIPNPAASPANSQSYKVTVTDANNCSNKDSILVTVNSCTGIQLISFTNAVRIFPNPFVNSFSVEVGHWSQGLEFTLYDVLERKINSVKLTDKISVVNRGSLNAGIYFWKVNNERGEIIGSGKVVVE